MCAQGGGKEEICLVRLFLWMQWCLCIEVVFSGNFSKFKITFFSFFKFKLSSCSAFPSPLHHSSPPVTSSSSKGRN